MTLRDELLDVAESTFNHMPRHDGDLIDAVLASPPLQALRSVLANMARQYAVDAGAVPDAVAYYSMEWLTYVKRLPESVAEWVLGEEQ